MQDLATRELNFGPLSKKTKDAKNYQHIKASFDEPDRITNSSIKEPLSQVHEWRGASARPGSLDFLNLKSRGVAC
jgi:hypothetical protein